MARCGCCGQLVDDTAGLAQLDTSLEILYLLPDGFVRAYSELFHAAYRDRGPSVLQRDPDSQRSGKKKKPGRMQAGAGGKRFIAGRWVVRSAKAMVRKEYVDRQLRKLARWITSRNVSEEELTSKCGCGIWLEPNWHYCPKCGTGLT
jgi:hypothetical protein